MAKMRGGLGEPHGSPVMVYDNLTLSRAKRIMRRQGADTMLHKPSRIAFFAGSTFVGDYWKRGKSACSESLLVVCK